jgi:hypothetical protein
MATHSLDNAVMDSEHLEIAEAREPVEATEQHARVCYDEAALGVECAWPAAEREALLTLS